MNTYKITALLLWALALAASASAQIGGGGWTPVAVKFDVQSPINAPRSARYFFTNDIYHCLTYSDDSPFAAGNKTLPRTEQRFPDYKAGAIQYQARLMAPAKENSYCIFQIHTSNAESHAFGSTTFMLFWFAKNNGSVCDYSGTTLATDLGNQWFQLNVEHNLVTHTVKAWINRKLVWTQKDNGAKDYYMKDGVYEQHHQPTHQMDLYIAQKIQIWVSSGVAVPTASAGGGAAPDQLGKNSAVPN